MSAALDALIRKAHHLEGQIEQLTTELARLRNAIAARMGEEREYYGQGV
jgi:prefoldin subunit 5